MPNWSSRRGRTRSRSSSGWSPRAPGCPGSSSWSRHSTRSLSTWSGRTRRGRRRGRMHKVWAVVRREFVERIRSKWFWVMALLGPVFFGVVFLLPALLAGRAGIKRIVVVGGEQGPVGPRHDELLDQSGVFHAVRVPAPAHVVDSLTTAVGAKRLDGFLLLTDAAVDSGTAEYRGSNVSAFGALAALERTIGEVVDAVRLEHAGVDPQVVARAGIRVHLVTQKIAGGRTTGESAAQSFSLAYFMAIILYTAILIYGINVMSSVLEEKTTRIVEVLVSSLRPFQLMLGKLIGVGAVSIFQFLIWAVSARYLISTRGHIGGRGGGGGGRGPVFPVPPPPGAPRGGCLGFFLVGFFSFPAVFPAFAPLPPTAQEAPPAPQPVQR